MMLTIPSWKAELMERKKVGKTKTDLVPEWKKDLLKRLHSKTETARLKMEDDTKQNDQTVLNEHIMKVSDNIFVRQESNKKLSVKPQKPFKPPQLKDKLSGGYVVTRANNVVIIEKDDTDDEVFNGRSEVDEEMPTSGIVNRLKDKFIDHDKEGGKQDAGYQRSRSSDNVFDHGAPKEEAAAVAIKESQHSVPYPRAYSLPSKSARRPPSTTRARKDSNNSLNFFTPKSFSSKTDETHRVTSPTRKVSAPVSPPTSPPAAKANVTPFTERFTPRSVEPPKHDKHKAESGAKSTLPASGAVDVAEPLFDITTVQPEKITIPKTYHGYVTKGKEVVPPLPKSAPESDLKTPAARKQYQPVAPVTKPVAPVSSLSKAVPPKVETQNKTNKAPSIRSDSARTVEQRVPKATAGTRNKQDSNGFQMVDLGKTSMDPSLLKSKAAIAANEIMKESKTMMIIPKNRTTTSAAPPAKEQTARKTTVKQEPVKSDTKSSDIASGRAEVVNKFAKTDPQQRSFSKPTANHVVSEPPKNVKPLPVSSVDDVIIKGSTMGKVEQTATHKPSHVTNSSATKSVAPVKRNNFVASSTTKAAPVSTKLTSSVNATAANNIAPKNNVVNRSSAPVVQSMFGTKLNSGGFGGKSFVIDPSKFKRSSAAPAASSNTTVQKKKTESASSNSRVIKPNASQNNVAGNEIQVDGNVAPAKGKRKLTVDQIQVIGGYVKLDRSCLSKSHHNHKARHVRFDQGHMESVFEYPSEKSLLVVEGDMPVMPKSSLAKLPGSGKDSQLGKYTPKYLLSMKESLGADEDDEEDDSKPAAPPARKSVDITPVANAEDFSSASADLLF